VAGMDRTWRAEDVANRSRTARWGLRRLDAGKPGSDTPAGAYRRDPDRPAVLREGSRRACRARPQPETSRPGHLLAHGRNPGALRTEPRCATDRV